MSKPTFDFDQPLHDEDGQVDPDALVDYAYELVALFVDAPEGAPFDDDDLDASESTIFELIERGLAQGVRPHQLTAPVLEQILLQGLPRGWRHPAEAASILEELTAFLRFAGRALGVPAAAGCVALLEAEGTKARLEAAFREFNLTCPDPELARFLQEDPTGRAETAEEAAPRASPGPPARSREEQRKVKDKKKDKKKAKRRNRG